MNTRANRRGPMDGATIGVPALPIKPQRIAMRYSVDEDLLAKIKLLRIRPSAVIDRELRREVRRREKALKARADHQVVNRFSGEVLTTK